MQREETRGPRAGRSALVAVALLALAALFATPVRAAGGESGAALFDPGAVAAIELTASEEAIAALEADPGEYVPASISIGTGTQQLGPYTVGLRLKGKGSFQPLTGKAAFKVKFGEYVKGQRVDGLKSLTLNNMTQDPSMLAETLAYEVFRRFGVAAPRTGYAFVRLNGEPYGLYANVETPDDIWLPRWFASTGHLYEADAWGTDLEPGGAGAFEVEEGEEGDLSDLEALIEAANDDEGDWSDGVAAHADLAQMTRMWAVERYIGHWDGYAGRATPATPNNYFLHSDESGVFSMTPWGTDQTWVERLAFDQPAGLLFDRCLADASCADLYRDALTDLGPLVASLGLDRFASVTADLLRPCQELESPKRRGTSLEQVEDAIAGLRAFLVERPAELAAWLGVSPPPPSDGPARATGFQPCPLPPDEEGGEQGQPGGRTDLSGAERKRPRPAKLIAARATRAAVLVRVRVPGRGRVLVRVEGRLDGRWRHGCTARRRHDRGGRLSLRCPLAPRLRRRAGEGMRLRVRVAFRSAEGETRQVVRRLRLAAAPAYDRGDG